MFIYKKKINIIIIKFVYKNLLYNKNLYWLMIILFLVIKSQLDNSYKISIIFLFDVILEKKVNQKFYYYALTKNQYLPTKKFL